MKLTTLKILTVSLFSTLLFASCAVNPVTGKNELLLVGEDWELAVGKQQYAPLRQSQGGDYTADPGVEEYVKRVGAKLAAQSDRELPYEFNVINDSTPNAWALPGGKISINRGLLTELQDESELAAVLGHEIVHSAAKHGARGASRGMLLQGAVVAATIAGSRNGYGQAAQAVSSIGAQLTNQKYGRDAEFESDLFGMRYMAKAGYDPQGAVGLQETFVRLSEGRRSDFLTNLFASHPPSQERVRRNRETAAALGANGDRGRERYQRAMARLTKSAPAYDKFAQAQQEYKANNLRKAIDLTNEAIRIEPREGHFQSFLGDISMQVNKPKAANSYYSKAISLNPDFFYYRVRRGQANQQTGNMQAARTDYQNSIKLLPNAEAQYGLGIIERDAGNGAAAKEYLSAASQSGGEVGERATEALLDLDLGDSPGNYLIVNRGLTNQGTFGIQLVNKTSRPMNGIRLGIVINGERTTSNVSGTVAAGQTRLIDTGRRMSQAQANAIEVVVLDAKVQR